MVQSSQPMNPSYGYLWWLNSGATYLVPGLQFPFVGPLCPAAPLDLYAALGKNDQKIHVVPSKGWVIVRQGNSSNLSPVPIVFDQQMWLRLQALDCGATGIGRVEPEPTLLVYPTLAQAGWWVESAIEIKEVRVWSLDGRLVRSDRDLSGHRIFVPAVETSERWFLLEMSLADGRKAIRRVRVGK